MTEETLTTRITKSSETTFHVVGSLSQLTIQAARTGERVVLDKEESLQLVSFLLTVHRRERRRE